jgi:hypothetical protein
MNASLPPLHKASISIRRALEELHQDKEATIVISLSLVVLIIGLFTVMIFGSLLYALTKDILIYKLTDIVFNIG